ncbi:DUF2795 domain-containing protein [Billgrantia sulfidoxydans]|nr:DUF2795 domain-containing protein [Halomonas sulfidoxydans]
MAQFTCEICGATFEQKSRYERHMLTSHPTRAVSAADLEKALRGIDFPVGHADLVDAVRGEEREIRDIVAQLPSRRYRDAADVAQAFGELRTHAQAADDQPGGPGGERSKRP